MIDDGAMELHRCKVDPAWIDWNGHMNVAYYVLAADQGVDHFCDAVGMDGAYRARSQRSIFAAESHVTYQKELKLNDPLVVTMQILGFDNKRLHWFWRLYNAEAGYLAATLEWMTLSVDLTTRRVAPWEAPIYAGIDAIWQRHRLLPRPAEMGRVIGVPGQSSSR